MYRESIDSPVGPLTIMADDEAIKMISFEQKSLADNPSSLTTKCGSELAEYFHGTRTTFSVSLAPEGTPFQLRVWSELLKIPYSRSVTYSDIATRLGDIKKIRAAATANGKNPIPIIIPCHRVIGKDGSLTGFSGGLDKKAWLLRHEGIISGAQMPIFS